MPQGPAFSRVQVQAPTNIQAGSGVSVGGGGVPIVSLTPTADGTILANMSGAPNSPAADSISTILDHTLGTIQGDIIFRDAATWNVLPAGTAGQVLVTGGGGANPSWQTLTTYGVGAPVALRFESAIYFDTTGAPYHGYVQHSGAWHQFS